MREDLIELAKQQAAEIARAGHNGWGNTMLALAAALEAAREEVRRLNFEVDAAAIYGDDRDAHYLQAETRAERLAEALREMIELREATQRGEVHPTRHELDIVKDARALLREQEERK